MLTQEQFKAALPKQMQGRINTEVMDKINDTLRNPDTRDMLKENMLGYVSVMQNGKFQVEQYINAVKYVSFKTMGDTNIAAYTKTFPDKYQDFLNRGVAPKDIASYITAYNKSKLVNLIYEQSLVPTYILNADKVQKAINNLAEIGSDPDVCSRDRVAANVGLLTTLKRSEAQKIELDIGIKESSYIDELKNITAKFAAKQLAAVESGLVSPKELAQQSLIIEGEAEEVL